MGRQIRPPGLAVGLESNLRRVLPSATLASTDRRFTSLWRSALSKFPSGTQPIRSVSRLDLERRGEMEGLAGLTNYCCVTMKGNRKARGQHIQTITLYSELLDELSGDSSIGVIAHELAHAWLNEHERPEESQKREKEADELARRWGYGKYLDALSAETDSV